jgi:hypothetical protein
MSGIRAQVAVVTFEEPTAALRLRRRELGQWAVGNRLNQLRLVEIELGGELSH